MHSRRKIDRYLSGDVTQEAALRDHLAACEACRAYYDAGVLALRAARAQPGSAGAGELERIERRARLLAPAARSRRTRSPRTAKSTLATVELTASEGR